MVPTYLQTHLKVIQAWLPFGHESLYPSTAMPHYQKIFILRWTLAVASTPVSRWRMVPRDSDEEWSWPELLRRNVGPALIDAKTVLVPIILGANGRLGVTFFGVSKTNCWFMVGFDECGGFLTGDSKHCGLWNTISPSHVASFIGLWPLIMINEQFNHSSCQHLDFHN